MHQCSKFLLSILILKVERIYMSINLIWGYRECWILLTVNQQVFFRIWMWSLVFDTPMIQTWALNLDLESAKTIHVFWNLIWGFGGHWGFLTEVWHLDFDLDMVTGFWSSHVPNFGSVWIWRCKEHLCPLSPDLELWGALEVCDWDFESWSWIGYGHWSLKHPWSKFWLSILILKVQRTLMSFKSSFGALEDTAGSWLEFGILIFICICSLVFNTTLIWILAL